MGESRKVRALLEKCGPLFAADHRPMAHLRYWLDSDPAPSTPSRAASNTPSRTLLAPKHNTRNQLFFDENFPQVQPPPGPRRLRQPLLVGVRGRELRRLNAPERHPEHSGWSID